LGSVPHDALGLGGTMLLPVASVVGAPLPGAVAANFAILRIKDELLFSVLATALLLAGLVRTHGLLRMKSGRFELFLAETTTPLLHPFKVTTLPISFRKVNPASLNWEKIPDRRSLRVWDWRIGRSSAT
jgi:hypothetical protein